MGRSVNKLMLAVIVLCSFPYAARADEAERANSTSESTALNSSVATTADAKTPSAKEQSRAYYLKAKRLIVDGFPEDREAAESHLLNAIRVAPYEPEAFAELSRFTLWQIANSIVEPTAIYQASELAEHVKEIAPDRPLGSYLECEILLAAGQYQQALRIYADVREKFPEHTDTLVFEARFWSDIEPMRALKAAQQALTRGYPMDDLSPAIAEAIVKTSDTGEVGENLQRFATVYPDRWLWHRAAMAYTEEKQIELAKASYLKAIALGNSLESRLQLAILQYSELKEASFAVKNLEVLRAELAKKANVKTDTLGMVDAHLAIATLDKGDVRGSLEIAERAMRLGNGSMVVTNSVVTEFARRGRDIDLQPALEKLAQENPAHEYVHITLGNLANKSHQYHRAVEWFTNAILLMPERDDLYSARAHALYSTNDFASALNDFELAIKYRPDSGSHRYNRACMLARLGRKAEALDDLKEAITLDQELKELARNDADLEALRRDTLFETDLVAMGVLSDAH